MNTRYDPRSFFTFLGYGPGNAEYSCPDLKTLNVYCRGNRAQMERLVACTPFTLTSDIFLATVADFANVTFSPYFDGAIIFPISYKEHRAGTYFFEFEDQHWSTASGRELWGYPKRYTKIALDKHDAGAKAQVRDYDKAIMDLAVDFDDKINATPWQDIAFTPTIQARAVPELNGPSFSLFDIIMRNTAANFVVKQRYRGKAHITLGAVDIGSNLLNGEPLIVEEVLGGEYIIGDFASTTQNGTPVILDRLVGEKS